MSPIYTKEFKLRAEHVDYRRKLSLISLMRLFQECCIAHTEELGMGRKKTLDRGYLWVISNEHILIHRMPEYDEDVILRCYPGPMLHYFFPRHFQILDQNHQVLVEISAIWALIDIKSRRMIDPKEKGIKIEGEESGKEIPMAMFINVPPLPHQEKIKATYSLTDINGHLGNSGYASIALDHVDPSDLGNDIHEVKIVFKKEIAFGESFSLSYGKIENAYYFACPQFAMEIVF